MPRETTDTPAQLNVAGRSIAGMLHSPPDGRVHATGVFCNAFGDERKSSCLAVTRLARTLASRGMAVLRFDYWGCGDSPGEFADASVATRLADIRGALEYLSARSAADTIWLLGLRLGATLAARAAEQIRNCAGLVLIEPIPDGGAYVEALLQRKRVRQMLTTGSGSGRAAATQDTTDLDGYALRQSTVDELRALRIAPGEVGFSGPVLIVQASFNDKPKREAEAVRGAYEAAGARVDIRPVVLPPFWSRIDITDTSLIQEAVVGWCEAIGALP